MAIFASLPCFLFAQGPPASSARADTPMTAGVVLEKMAPKEYYAYLAGITEGLAYARYERGGVEAMKCVFDWFYNDKNSVRRIDQAFARFADHYPGAVMAALMERKCGE